LCVVCGCVGCVDIVCGVWCGVVCVGVWGVWVCRGTATLRNKSYNRDRQTDRTSLENMAHCKQLCKILVHCRDQIDSVYCTNRMHSINCVCVLQQCVRDGLYEVTVTVY